MARKPLTRAQITAAANQCSTRTEFANKHGGAYTAAKRMGIFDKVTVHMPTKADGTSNRMNWTKESVMIEAKRFTNISDFRVNAPRAYSAAKRYGMLQTIRIVYGEPQWGSITKTKRADTKTKRADTKATQTIAKAKTGTTAAAAKADDAIAAPAFGTSLTSAISKAVVDSTMGSLAQLHGELAAHASIGSVPAAVASELAGTMQRLRSITA